MLLLFYVLAVVCISWLLHMMFQSMDNLSSCLIYGALAFIALLWFVYVMMEVLL